MNCYFFKAREGGAYGCNRPGDNSGAYFRVEDVIWKSWLRGLLRRHGAGFFRRGAFHC